MLRSLTTAQVKKMHTQYTVCSSQGSAVYRLALATQVPSLHLAVGYQNENTCICLGHVLELNISPFSPCEPAANYIQGCTETLGWLAGLLVWRLYAPLSALFCLCAFDRIHQTEGSQSRELPSVSLTHITLGLYHIMSQYKSSEDSRKSLQPRDPSYPALLSMTSGRPWMKECGRGDGTFQQALVAS